MIVASTLTTRNADVSLKCLSLGAVDYIGKPSTNRDVTFGVDFRRELIDKVKTLGNRRRERTATRSNEPQPLSARPRPPQTDLTLRPVAKVRPNILLVGASTGGPTAVTQLLKAVRPALQRIPIIIAQHMPATFTTMFAEHLRRTLAIDASEAQHGDPIEPGRVYVAPGGRHLKIKRQSAGICAVVDDSPAVNFCRPSVDVTFKSVSALYGAGALGVILTGMGSDGLDGSQALVEAGGNLIAQDEQSSVVWGMPGAVARRGLCSAVDRVENLARIVNVMAGAGQS